jgi:hypothetical protein
MKHVNDPEDENFYLFLREFSEKHKLGVGEETLPIKECQEQQKKKSRKIAEYAGLGKSVLKELMKQVLKI